MKKAAPQDSAGSVNRDAYCPSCDRFIGPRDTCPYCDADSARSPAWRRLRWSALCLAVVGLIFLHMAARHRDPPRVRIADIGPMMNFGWVEIAGTVSRKAYTMWEGSDLTYAAFTVDDGSGRMRVTLSGKAAAASDRDGRLPAGECGVRVRGTLEFGRDNSLRLRVHRPEHIEIGAGTVPKPQGVVP